GTDPQRALALALDAARLDPSVGSEDALRQALLVTRLRRQLRIGTPVTFASFSRDRLVTGSVAGVRIWDPDNGRLLRAVHQDPPLVPAAVDPRGDRLLAAGGDPARVSSSEDGRLLETLPHHRVTAAAFSPDGTRIVTGGGDRRLRIWRTGNGMLLGTVLVPGA